MWIKVLFSQVPQLADIEITGGLWFFSAKTWNSLFLGVNSVMDVMAEKYHVTKTQILESDATKQSAAVRVALGETQIVNETREFLVSHGVKLDAFSQVRFPEEVLSRRSLSLNH